MNDWDFGVYGKGVEGYAHYNAANNRAHKNSGGGKRPNNNGGCLSCLLMLLLPALSVAAVYLVR